MLLLLLLLVLHGARNAALAAAAVAAAAVGVYRDICVERKSISDLMQSLNSGRLYHQVYVLLLLLLLLFS